MTQRDGMGVVAERLKRERMCLCAVWGRACMYIHSWSLVAQPVKNLPAMQETPVQFLGREDPPGDGIGYPLQYSWASPVAQTVKNLPAMWETWVGSLVWEDLLEDSMAIHSSILAGESPWTEEPGRLQSMGSQRVRQGWATKHSTA